MHSPISTRPWQWSYLPLMQRQSKLKAPTCQAWRQSCLLSREEPPFWAKKWLPRWRRYKKGMKNEKSRRNNSTLCKSKTRSWRQISSSHSVQAPVSPSTWRTVEICASLTVSLTLSWCKQTTSRRSIRNWISVATQITRCRPRLVYHHMLTSTPLTSSIIRTSTWHPAASESRTI